MKKKILIIGYGSIGKKHANIIKNYFKNYYLYILTSQKITNLPNIKSLEKIKDINPDFIIISSETHKHYKHLSFLEKNFENKNILVEKPLFDKKINFKIKKNISYINMHNYIFRNKNGKINNINQYKKIQNFLFSLNK